MATPCRHFRARVLGTLLLLAPALAHPGQGQSPPGGAAPSSGPQVVEVSLLINSVSDIDSARETFRGDFYLTLQWHDPALLTADPENIDWSRFQKPLIEFMNYYQDVAPVGDEPPRLVSPGVAASQIRYIGTFTSRMDLEEFPFDEQTLALELESQTDDAKNLVFSFRPSKGAPIDIQNRKVNVRQDIIIPREIHLPEWTITGIEVGESKYLYYEGTKAFSHLRFDLKIARRIGYYVWKVMALLVILVILSWGVFLIDPGDIGNRLAVSITLLLAAVAFAFVTGSLIPRVSYLTLLDLYVLGCYVLLFLGAAESLLVYQMRARDTARKVDRLALACFPAAFLLLHLFLWIRS
jgi:neurotransmitter-gated ion-channel